MSINTSMMQNFGLEDLSHVQSRRNLLKYLVRVETASDWFGRTNFLQNRDMASKLGCGLFLFFSYLNKIWLSVWRHHLANLHILKTWISLERKEIFENSKQYFSAHEVYLFMFQNGLDRKDAILVNRPFKWTGKYIRPQKSHEKSHRDQYL